MQEFVRDEMQEWLEAGRQALLSGTLASVLSTAVLAVLGKSNLGKPVAPTNATSHWLWGEQAYDVHEPSMKHTAVGYATHHASAMMWATLFERWLNYSGAIRSSEIVRDAAAMTAIASFVDYQLTPPRLRPGFEQHLSRGELLGVFAAFGAGLAIGAILNRRHERRMDELMRLPTAKIVH
jgi:hypothetical protein